MTDNSAEFVSIPNFEGLYEVSREGEVRSIGRLISAKQKADGTPSFRKSKTRTLKSSPGTDGFRQVALCYPGEKPKWHKVHRLVAAIFIPQEVKPGHFLTGKVIFKDEDRANCHADNLEWESKPLSD